jgi:hypothetical protein
MCDLYMDGTVGCVFLYASFLHSPQRSGEATVVHFHCCIMVADICFISTVWLNKYPFAYLLVHMCAIAELLGIHALSGKCPSVFQSGWDSPRLCTVCERCI